MRELLKSIGHCLLRAAATQERTDPGEKLARREGLGKVIVSA
jgi:hypothetical protein